MKERLGTLSAKCKPKIFQNVLWEAAAINAQELATAKPCLLAVGTLEWSQGWALAWALRGKPCFERELGLQQGSPIAGI